MRRFSLSSMFLLIVCLVTLSLAPPAYATDPVVSSVSYTVGGMAQCTLVDVSFTFTQAENTPCYIHCFSHDASTYEYIPMCHFTAPDVHSRTYLPGTYTVTWIASADFGGRTTSNFQVFVRVGAAPITPGEFIVIDVSGGSAATSYPVQHLPWVDYRLDIYKADKIVLRQLPDGSYVGVYEVTQKQYQDDTGATPSSFSGNPKRPVEQVSYNDITDSADYTTGFFKLLRDKAGLATLDLPESTAWEYACRAGSAYNYADYTQNRGKGSDATTSLDTMGWYESNCGSRTHDVAAGRMANAWGLYDMHGNVWEWTKTIYSGTGRLVRGGCWPFGAGYYTSGCVNDSDRSQTITRCTVDPPGRYK